MDTITKTQVAKLVARGIKKSQIANAVGVSRSRISELLTDDPFIQEKIQEFSLEYGQANIQRVESLQKIEDIIIKNLRVLASNSDSLGESMRALRQLKDIQAIESSGSDLVGGGIAEGEFLLELNLNGVSSAQVEIKKGSTGNILAIKGKSFQPMTPEVIEGVFERLDKEEADRQFCETALSQENLDKYL